MEKNERSCWKEKYQTERKLLVEFFQDVSRDWSYLTFLTTLAEKVVLCLWNFLIMQYVVWKWRRTVYRKNWISFRTGIIEMGWIWITQKVRSGTLGLFFFFSPSRKLWKKTWEWTIWSPDDTICDVSVENTNVVLECIGWGTASKDKYQCHFVTQITWTGN